jgi:hypothetical protein
MRNGLGVTLDPRNPPPGAAAGRYSSENHESNGRRVFEINLTGVSILWIVDAQ